MRPAVPMPPARAGVWHWVRALPALPLALVGACAWFQTPPPGIGAPVAWSRLPDWQLDRHAEAWPAFLRSCEKLASRKPMWDEVCGAAAALPAPSDDDARRFFETHLRAHEVTGVDGEPEGMITGYYEPLLTGSLTRSERFRYPLYRRPDNLLIIDLGGIYPELKGRPVRGRLDGNRVVPFFSRAEIGNGARPLSGSELLWVDDPVDLFILQVQGSGRVLLPDGSVVAVGYADQNGHPYVSIGGRLVQAGALKREEVTLPRIREWLAAHPDEAETLLNSNPSFVFFGMRDGGLTGPIGSLNVPLTPQRSIAVDPAYITLGTPVWIATELPDGSAPYRRLVLAQDTGGAIKGPVRADVFFGQGVMAEQLAGTMKQRGRLYVLLPRPTASSTTARAK